MSEPAAPLHRREPPAPIPAPDHDAQRNGVDLGPPQRAPGPAPTGSADRRPESPSRREPAPSGGEAANDDGPSLADAGNAALYGLLKDHGGDFIADLGPAPGLHIPANLLKKEIDLSTYGRVIPGVVFDKARFNAYDRRHMLAIKGHFDIPYVKASSFTVNVSDKGLASLDAQAQTTIGALGNPLFKVKLENKQLSATAAISGLNLTPKALRNRMTVTGGGTIQLSGGKLSGDVNATVDIPKLGGGSYAVSFSESGEIKGSGSFALSADFLDGVHADLKIDSAGSLAASVSIPAASIKPRLPGLKVESGMVQLDYLDGTPSGALDNLLLSYPGLGSASVSAAIKQGRFDGKGAFDLAIAGFANVAGTWAFHDGALTGAVEIAAKDFPKALPVKGGKISGKLGPTGAVSFAGKVEVTLGPAGKGEIRASYSEAGELMIGATVNLTVPGLKGASFTVNYVEGELEGSGDVPIDQSLIPGLSGAVHVEFKQGRWAGETALAYSADNGKLSGTIHVAVAQTEEGPIQVSGDGDVTAELIPGKLKGTLRATLKPEGGVDITGKITVTEPVPLFPELRTDKELFKIQKNIPLWAILVAVIRVRAGIRAGIGPGVLRNITVEGSYSFGGEGDGNPSFTISGELFIPAFVEAYVAFGAGLGLDVVLGSLTGGIEGVATAGIYGAVSVIPELSYQNGDYSIEGTATLAAGARLKLSLNAWAEIEAFWVTVWDKKWELGEWMWNIGPDLALQAHMAYNFSRPEPPTLDFKTSDIDTESMISEAMPEDGPGPSGAKEALQNKAEWKGQLKKPAPPPPVPPELAQKAEAPKAAPAAPPKPAKPPPPPGAVPPKPAEPGAAGLAAVAGPGNKSASPGAPGAPVAPGAAPGPPGAPTPGTPPAPGSAAAVQDAAKPPATKEQALPPGQAPKSDQPRFPKALNLSMLGEPPVPVPRTSAEQQEDVDAAANMVGLAEDGVQDTAALEAYFPQIKKRFQLSSIRLEPEGADGAHVEVEINPKARRKVDELLRGDDLARTDSLKLKTLVEFQKASLGGDTVGSVMEAKLLGPDHPEGGPPSGQDVLMGKLPSRTGSEDENYVRGHLLNDNIGGPGQAHNLFPITQKANRQHLQYMESSVKKWVNQDRYWCYYKVAITNQKDNFNTSGPYFVSADIVTTAAVLKVGGKKSTELAATAVTIHSVAAMEPASGPAKGKGKADSSSPEEGVTIRKALDETGLAGHVAADFDLARPVALSSRARDATTELDPDLADATKKALAKKKNDDMVRNKVQEISGIGPGIADILVRLARKPSEFGRLEPSEVGLVTRLNETFKSQILKKLREL